MADSLRMAVKQLIFQAADRKAICFAVAGCGAGVAADEKKPPIGGTALAAAPIIPVGAAVYQGTAIISKCPCGMNF